MEELKYSYQLEEMVASFSGFCEYKHNPDRDFYASLLSLEFNGDFTSLPLSENIAYSTNINITYSEVIIFF